MVRRYLPLNPLRAFEAAARHLSFTRAAIELNVTHAAVSQQVRALEEQLGCVLFTRVSRGLVLTHEGEGLLPVLNGYPRNAVLFSLFADNVRRTEGFTKLAPSAVVIIGYGIAFYFLSLVLKSIPVGVAYAVWSGLGVVIITAIAWLLHGQKLDAWGFVGMGLIIAAFLLARSPSWKSLRRPTPW